MRKQMMVAFAILLISLTIIIVRAQEPQPEPQPSPFAVDDLPKIVSFILIFVGVLARAFSPYLRKWLNDEVIGFQKRYVAIIIASFVTAWLAFPEFAVAFTTWWQLITAAFIFGFGLQAAYTEIYTWFVPAQAPAPTPTPTPTPPS